MRKTSVYSAQDHIIFIIETDKKNDEGSCVSGGEMKGQYSNAAGILVEGTFEYFFGDSSSDIPDTHLFSANAPGFMAHTDVSGKSLGTCSSNNYCLNFAIFPKDENTLRLWEGQVGSKSIIDSLVNANRDNVFCFDTSVLNRQRDPVTFEDITVGEEEEEITITGIVYE